MKIQEQTINKQNGTSFWTIYFEQIISKQISENDWHIINEFIESCLNKIEKSEKPINLTSSQTEISDEEIEKRIKEVGAMGEYYKWGYRDAIIWYIEQLKLKNNS